MCICDCEKSMLLGVCVCVQEAKKATKIVQYCTCETWDYVHALTRVLCNPMHACFVASLQNSVL